jgi:hypothetical protein
MSLRTPLLVIAWLLLAPAMECLAQELENFPGSALTREPWLQRVEDARRRSEEFVANARTQMADLPSSDKEDAEAADQRAMNDPSLQLGDIVSTSKGLLVFVGRSEEHRPSDFLPAPNPQYPP